MIQRLALFLASLASALALAFGLAATGIVPGAPASVADPAVATLAPAPEPSVQVDTVYLTPPVPPQEITVVSTAQGHGERDGEHEGRSDD